MLKTLLRGLLGDSGGEPPAPKVAVIQPAQSLPTLAEVDRMDGTTFEAYLMGVFSCLGYEIETTPHFDQGADLVLIRNGVRTAVQAKRWKGDVDVNAVRAVIASMRPYNCTQAMVVTNASNFTLPARSCARDNDVMLWGRKQLKEVLVQIGVEQRTQPGNQVCRRCGTPVSEKVTRYCLSQPDRFGGEVYCYTHQRRGYRARAS